MNGHTSHIGRVLGFKEEGGFICIVPPVALFDVFKDPCECCDIAHPRRPKAKLLPCVLRPKKNNSQNPQKPKGPKLRMPAGAWSECVVLVCVFVRVSCACGLECVRACVCVCFLAFVSCLPSMRVFIHVCFVLCICVVLYVCLCMLVFLLVSLCVLAFVFV